MYEECGDEKGHANANTELGVVYGEMGDYGKAQECLTLAANLYNDLDNKIGQGNVELALGVLYREMGDYHLANTHLKQAFNVYGHAGSRHGQADAYLGLGILARLTGSHSRARDDLVKALSLFTELDSQQGEATVHTELGDLCDQIGDRTGALHHGRGQVLYILKWEVATLRRFRDGSANPELQVAERAAPSDGDFLQVRVGQGGVVVDGSLDQVFQALERCWHATSVACRAGDGAGSGCATR